ncbi:hypothetical protein B0H66DRAFT_168507 [Apodospora peruviana]|uniref:2,6-dihydroxypyridine 3-monooxygenase substrate binding domain-containing protein n=1 Tax=Apodospora peruviana TaxID=516989 RepID=A0AAE0IKS6_9PEZI|nr:hypothetical protein B0H66DRAFT_168507 [Apodospora peruviana]
MSLKVRDKDSDEIFTDEADAVVAAVCRNYVGYITWRGTVPERQVSASTPKLFQRSITAYRMNGHHCLVYAVPGEYGSLKPDERYLNFLWYTNESGETVNEIMKDGVTGHRHHYIVPSGRVRQDILECSAPEGQIHTVSRALSGDNQKDTTTFRPTDQ